MISRAFFVFTRSALCVPISPRTRYVEASWASDVAVFSRVRKIRGSLLVVWDGASIYSGQPIKEFLRQVAAKRLLAEQAPGYTPELNPAKELWNDPKRVEKGNLVPRPPGVVTRLRRWAPAGGAYPHSMIALPPH